jgi:2-polyprenyl-3-methyl-5-hydroxy-6-metoxy-1,4-benzoquinol methylase
MTEQASEQATSPHTSRYHYEIDPVGENSVHAMELSLIGNSKRVLEVGCASGHMTAELVRRGCRVVGLEIEAAAAAANEHAEEVLVVDLDRDDFVEKLRGRQFDAALLGDVLEHLRDPGQILKSVRELLVPGGFVVLCVPNVAFVDVRLALLRGKFPYNDWGLLDRTHIRFFTKATLDQVIADAGYMPVETRRAILAPFASELAPDRSIPQEVVEIALDDPEALTYQFVMKAVIDDGDLAVHQLADRCRELEDRLHQIRVETELQVAAELQELDELDDLRQRISELEARVVEAEREAAEIRATKLFRYSTKARAVYRSLFIQGRRR